MFIANYVPKCQMSSGPYGPIFFILFYFLFIYLFWIFQIQSAAGNVIQQIKKEKPYFDMIFYPNYIINLILVNESTNI